MKGKRRLATVLGALVIAGAASAPVWAPTLLRRVPVFEIRRVEVSGMHLVAPHELLATSGVQMGQNLWDDPDPWLVALLGHPGVAAASIERVLPGTLRIRVEERQPVAFVEEEVLRAATVTGELLPVDPSRVNLDLPLVRGAIVRDGDAGDRVGDEGTRHLLAELGAIAAVDRDLFSRISEVSRDPAGHAVLALVDPAMRVMLPGGTDRSRLHRLLAVLEDLEKRDSGRRPDAADPIRVDLRFADQVVVRIPS
jgi:cell division protein FtsQ